MFKRSVYSAFLNLMIIAQTLARGGGGGSGGGGGGGGGGGFSSGGSSGSGGSGDWGVGLIVFLLFFGGSIALGAWGVVAAARKRKKSIEETDKVIDKAEETDKMWDEETMKKRVKRFFIIFRKTGAILM